MPTSAPRLFFVSLCALAALVGCSTGVASNGRLPAGTKLALFHTSSALMVAHVEATDGGEVKTRVDNIFPSACFDRDDNDDGIPDSLQDSDAKLVGMSSQSLNGKDGPSDGGVEVPESGGGSKGDQASDGGEKEDTEHGCKRCNRGPGQQGDFRFEVSGTAGKLGRGRVYTSVNGTLTIPSSLGNITVVITSSTRVDDGVPAPGSEIQAEGTVTQSNGLWTLTASRVKVLCPAPPAVDPTQLPPGTTPVPTPTVPPGTGTGPTDGGTCQALGSSCTASAQCCTGTTCFNAVCAGIVN